MAERHADVSYTTPGPMDRVHWGPVVAGMFVALSILVLSSVLALATGFGPTHRNGWIVGYAASSIAWGGLAAFVAFLVGSYLAAQWAGLRGSVRAALHGFLVWAVGVPVLVYGLGTGISPMLGTTTLESQSNVRVIQAGSVPGAADSDPAAARAAGAALSSAAWWMLVSLIAGLMASFVGGALGGRSASIPFTQRRH